MLYTFQGGPYGHVGVAVWNNDGTWTVGAVQGPGNQFVSPFYYNGGWVVPGCFWLDVESYLGGDLATKRPGVDTKISGSGIYDKIKIIKVSDPNSDQANTYMRTGIWALNNRGFWWPGNVCLDATVGTLKAYGVTGLPSEVTHPAPTDYFNSLTGPDYQQYTLDSVWKLYVPPPS